MKWQKFLVFSPLLLLSLVTASGCTTTAHVATEDSSLISAPSATEPSVVRLYYSKDLKTKYKVLGSIVAAADGDNGTKLIELLKTEAAALGANGITDLRLQVVQGFWVSGVEATALAIRK